MAEYYSSGNWQVTAGREEEFVEQWTDFLQETRKHHPAMLVATLLRDQKVPGHFVSIAEWADEDSRVAWKGSPEFATGQGACKALCDTFTGSDYARAVTI
jgi:quinol monooxygenase YgiN